MQGTMLWFNDVKDLGAITTEEGEKIPVHGTAFAVGERPEGRCAGSAVTFRIAEHRDGPEAEDVKFVHEVAPRRARMRHARYRS
jgi:cold shock CspA family protein